MESQFPIIASDVRHLSTNRINSTTATTIAVFLQLAERSYRTRHASNAHQRPIGRTGSTYMVCRGSRPLRPYFTAQRSRNGLPHAFGLNARLRAFSFGYRVVPIPNRNGQPPKSSKSDAPATAVARRVGALLVLKYYYHNYLASRTVASLSGDDFLRTTSALPGKHWFTVEEKAPGATPACQGRTTEKLRVSEV